MDAKTFLTEWWRMCKQHDICKECAADESCNKYTPTTPDAKLVDVVEKWAKEHPFKTNRDALIEKFGDVIVNVAIPSSLNDVYINGIKYYEWLNEEYKEPEDKENGGRT